MAVRAYLSALTWAPMPRGLMCVADFSVHLACAFPMRFLGVNGHRDIRLGGQLVPVLVDMVRPGGRTRALRFVG